MSKGKVNEVLLSTYFPKKALFSGNIIIDGTRVDIFYTSMALLKLATLGIKIIADGENFDMLKASLASYEQNILSRLETAREESTAGVTVTLN